jgi:hypothetical protein
VTTEKLYAVEMTQREASGYLHAVERATVHWYSGKAKNRYLQQRHVHSYNAIKKLMAELRRVVYADLGSPLNKDGTAFDLDLARENEVEARSLDAEPRDANPSVEID